MTGIQADYLEGIIMALFIDEFNGPNGSLPANWNVYEEYYPDTSGRIQSNQLRNDILTAAPANSLIREKLDLYTFNGDEDWSIEIDFNIINYFFGMQKVQIIHFFFMPTSGAPGYHGITIEADYDNYPDLTIFSRTYSAGYGNEYSPAPTSGTLKIENSSGNLILSYDTGGGFGWGGGPPVTLPNELDSINYTLYLTTQTASIQGRVTIDLDNFVINGTAVPAVPPIFWKNKILQKESGDVGFLVKEAVKDIIPPSPGQPYVPPTPALPGYSTVRTETETICVKL
jgi:hypothetical protein